MLANALNLDTPADVDSVLSVYDDVDADSLYAEQIAAVTKAEAFAGSDGKFNPGDDITREQMASVLVSGLGLEEYDNGEAVAVNLDNVSPSHADNVQVLANLGLTVATDDFRPSEEISRGAFATMLHGALNLEEPAAPEVESVTAVDATTIEVTLTNEETTELTLDEELTDGDNEVTFEVDGVKYTETVNFDVPPSVETMAFGETEGDVNENTITFTFADKDQSIDEATIELSETSTLTVAEPIDVSKEGNAAYTVDTPNLTSGYLIDKLEGTTLTVEDEAGNTTEYELSFEEMTTEESINHKLQTAGVDFLPELNLENASDDELAELDEALNNVSDIPEGWLASLESEIKENTGNSDETITEENFSDFILSLDHDTVAGAVNNENAVAIFDALQAAYETEQTEQ
ncbi:S-layer homology domain-containing protein [Lentibacillus lipolyticus]|nr:S-layer homology domain-containing protein [Lentibacillus lipolyticus]